MAQAKVINPVRFPTKPTLKKYGLSLEDWLSILESQNYMCPICHKVPTSGIYRVDHLHVKNYKKLSPDKKKLWVRGLTCVHCNRFYLAKGMNIEKARNMTAYLEAFEARH